MQTSWDLHLVVLSLAIAMIGSYVALDFASRMKLAQKPLRQIWFFSGAVIMGLAIWSIHFVGMMALIIPMPMSYDPLLLGLSILAAIMGSGLAFTIMNRDHLGYFHLITGSIAMGLAIAGMHYIGMASMRMPANIYYVPSLFILSISIAILASAGALWMAFHLRAKESWQLALQKGGSAIVMGGAIAGMHYTGMTAARYEHIHQVTSGFGTATMVGPFQLGDLLIVASAIFGVTLLLLNSQSIAERERALIELERSESRFSSIFNQASVGIAQTNLMGRVIFANQRFWEIFGLSNESDSRKNNLYIHDLIHPNELERCFKVVDAAIQTREAAALESQGILPDGKIVWVNTRITPVMTEQGDADHFIVVMQDVTERKIAETALEETRERFRLLVEEVKDYAIYWLDCNGNIVSWNKGAERIFGYSSESIIGLQFSLFFARGDEDYQALLAQAVLESKLELEMTQKRRGGFLFDTHVTITPIFNDLQELVGFSNITRDITQDKRAKEELAESHQILESYVERLEQSNRELEQFATIASHDLQAPLRKVMIYSDAIQASMADSLKPETQEYLTRLQKATGNMQMLITDLMALSRITRKGQPFRVVHLSDILRDVFSNLEERIRSEDARIEVDGTISLEADPVQIRQLLQNLLENALKFHFPEQHPHICIQAKELPNNQCEITIEDNGIGFEEKYADKIFAVFERLHSENQYPGTGMGLAICKKIVQRHGGKIKVSSKPGLGSRFTITLPMWRRTMAQRLNPTGVADQVQ